MNGTSLNNAGSNGNYWSSTLNSSTNAYNLNFNSGNVNPQNNNNRYIGRTVRPVSAFTPVFIGYGLAAIDESLAAKVIANT